MLFRLKLKQHCVCEKYMFIKQKKSVVNKYTATNNFFLSPALLFLFYCSY